MIELIAWVKTAQLPPAPFFLGGPHCQVLDTEGFRQGVLTDIDQGPDRPDYRVSILRKELLLLKEMCEGLSAEGGPRQEK